MMGKSTALLLLVDLLLVFLSSFPCYSSCLSLEASCVPALEKGLYNIRCNAEDGSKDNPTTVAIDRIVEGLLTGESWDDDNKYCNMGDWADAPKFYGYIYCPSPDKKACQDKLADGLDKLAEQCGKYRVGAQVVAPDGSCLRYERYEFCEIH